MNKRVIFGLLVFLACILGVYLLIATDTDRITNYPPKNKTIVAFGDSLVFGYGATKGNDFVSKLGTLLNREIINHGVSGDTTADGLVRLEDVMEEDPGLVIVLLGGNDFLRRLPLETTRSNLATIIEKLSSHGAVVVLLGVRGGIFNTASDEMYSELSEEYGTIYISDVLDGILLKPERMFDGIHPNDVGYALIAERLATIFQEYDL